MHPKDALQDFKTCTKIDPGNKDAKLKLVECQKIVRQLNFFSAIEVADAPSAADGLDVASMVVESDYDGVQLGNEMTQEFIDDMTERFKNGKKIPKKYVYQIILAVKNIVYDEATMVEVEIPEDVKLTVCGDTHGMCHSSRGFLRGAEADKINRPILRSHGTLQIERKPQRQALVSFQRRFCRPWFVVDRDRFIAVRQQVAETKQLLPEPRQPRDRRHEQGVWFRGRMQGQVQ